MSSFSPPISLLPRLLPMTSSGTSCDGGTEADGIPFQAWHETPAVWLEQVLPPSLRNHCRISRDAMCHGCLEPPFPPLRPTKSWQPNCSLWKWKKSGSTTRGNPGNPPAHRIPAAFPAASACHRHWLQQSQGRLPGCSLRSARPSIRNHPILPYLLQRCLVQCSQRTAAFLLAPSIIPAPAGRPWRWLIANLGMSQCPYYSWGQLPAVSSIHCCKSIAGGVHTRMAQSNPSPRPRHPGLPTDASAVFGAAAAYPPVAGAGVGSKSCPMAGGPGTLNGTSRAVGFQQRGSTPNSKKSEVMQSDAVKFVNMCESGGKEASELHAHSHNDAPKPLWGIRHSSSQPATLLHPSPIPAGTWESNSCTPKHV